MKNKFSPAALSSLSYYYAQFEGDLDLITISSEWKEYRSFNKMIEDLVFDTPPDHAVEVLYTGFSWLVNQR
jgi:hypothetical protein